MTAITDAGTATTLTTNDTTCVAADFVNPAVYNFAAVPGSDLIDGGSVIPGYPDTDYFGFARNLGAAPDVGALENQDVVPILSIQPFAPDTLFQRGAESIPIAWSHDGLTGNVDISYSPNGGTLFYRLATVAVTSSPYMWDPDATNAPASINTIIRIEQGAVGSSSEAFTLNGEYVK